MKVTIPSGWETLETQYAHIRAVYMAYSFYQMTGASCPTHKLARYLGNAQLKLLIEQPKSKTSLKQLKLWAQQNYKTDSESLHFFEGIASEHFFWDVLIQNRSMLGQDPSATIQDGDLWRCDLTQCFGFNRDGSLWNGSPLSDDARDDYFRFKDSWIYKHPTLKKTFVEQLKKSEENGSIIWDVCEQSQESHQIANYWRAKLKKRYESLLKLAGDELIPQIRLELQHLNQYNIFTNEIVRASQMMLD